MKPKRERRPRSDVWRLSPEELAKLEKEGADPRLTPSAARFHAAMCLCLGVPVGPLDEASATFLRDADAAMRTQAKAAGFKLHED
jgi:hypothetical protein